jgi:two-component system cell cycle sensor histidine kinase/response regulator CckA
MKEPLRIIHIEDSPEDVELIRLSLQREGFVPEVRRVETRAELFDVLTREVCDVILADYTLPGFNGIQALEIARSLKPEVPFIFVSGTITEETAVETLRNGATDYLLKDRPARLAAAIRRALEEGRERSLHSVLEKRLHQTRRLQAVSSLAGGVAHDINRLLTKIKGQASSLASKCRKVEGAPELADELSGTAEEGVQLMQRLLAFARQSEARLSWIDPSEKLKEITTAVKVILPPTVQVEMQLEPKLPAILADPEHLRRVVTNLVLNANDAMSEGGRITISAEVVQFDPVPPYLSELGDLPYLLIKVADTGAGMDEATRLRVFEPFFTTKPLTDGAGLGLSEVLGLMRIHNGLIDVQSEPGHGTVVSLFFPLSRQGPSPGQIKKIPPIQIPEAVLPF